MSEHQEPEVVWNPDTNRYTARIGEIAIGAEDRDTALRHLCSVTYGRLQEARRGRAEALTLFSGGDAA